MEAGHRDELVQDAPLLGPPALAVSLDDRRHEFIPRRHAHPPHRYLPDPIRVGSISDEATDQHSGTFLARQCAAANSIRLTSRTSKAVATSRASPSRCFLFCRGSRAARSAPIAAATVAIPPIRKPPQARRIPFKHRKVQRARKSDGWQGCRPVRELQRCERARGEGWHDETVA